MREKLIELIVDAIPPCYSDVFAAQIADHLIANGVVIAKMETTTKWIPVTERLPERDGKYLCNYHFGEHRNMTFTQVLDYYATDKAPHFQHENSYGMKVSHWMPLPEPPKGE